MQSLLDSSQTSSQSFESQLSSLQSLHQTLISDLSSTQLLFSTLQSRYTSLQNDFYSLQTLLSSRESQLESTLSENKTLQSHILFKDSTLCLFKEALETRMASELSKTKLASEEGDKQICELRKNYFFSLGVAIKLGNSRIQNNNDRNYINSNNNNKRFSEVNLGELWEKIEQEEVTLADWAKWLAKEIYTEEQGEQQQSYNNINNNNSSLKNVAKEKREVNVTGSGRVANRKVTSRQGGGGGGTSTSTSTSTSSSSSRRN